MGGPIKSKILSHNPSRFSNIDSVKSQMARSVQSSKAKPGGSTIAGFRSAGTAILNKSPILLSNKTVKQAIDLPDAIAGHIGSPSRRADKIATAFNEALVQLRGRGGNPSQSVKFSVDMPHTYRGKMATYEFKGRMLRNKETKKFDRAAVNLVKVNKFD